MARAADLRRGGEHRAARAQRAGEPARGLKVLVVDDDSPDGTGEVADRLAGELPVQVLHRQGKKGLASAYVAGFGPVLGRSTSWSCRWIRTSRTTRPTCPA